MFEIGQDVKVIDSYTNRAEVWQIAKVTKTTVTVIGWDFTAEFNRKDDSFWNGEFYLAA
jgi:hypothetical protein